MPKSFYIAVAVILALSFSFSSKQNNLKFIAKKEKFKKDEDVCFELINESDEVFFLPSSAPWVVFEDDTENIVYSPVAVQRIEKVKPKTKRSWCWKQTDINEDKVPVGKYRIRLTVFTADGKKVFKSLYVEIVPEYKN